MGFCSFGGWFWDISATLGIAMGRSTLILLSKKGKLCKLDGKMGSTLMLKLFRKLTQLNKC